MDVAIVFKADGTIQCQDKDPISLEHHAAELKWVGASKICGQGNLLGPFGVSRVCGAPTGRVNAFAIPKADWETISTGFVGTLGFRPWSGAPTPPLAIDGDCRISSSDPVSGPEAPGSTLPVLICELVGRPCRCYRRGDALTKDFIAERVNVEHDADGRISDIWFG